MTSPTFTTGSAVVAVDARTRQFRDAVLTAAGSPEVLSLPASPNAVLVESRPGHERPAGSVPVTRGVTREADGTVVIESAGGSGYRQRWDVAGDTVRVESQWHPSAQHSLAARALPVRFRALRGQVLLHHPVLWWGALQGLAPLHVSVLDLHGTVVALAGPGGVGKTSLVTREVAAGARATCDNLALSDGEVMYGLREPLRIPADIAGNAASGPRAAHGRREVPWATRVPALHPDLLVVVRRDGDAARLRTLDRDAAQRALVAGTMCAGELTRFWPLAAVLALATGRGPVQPPVAETARVLVERVPCHELQLGPTSGHRLGALLASLTGTATEAPR
jgi:hypothetical protein